MEEKSFEQLNREFDSLCEAYDPSYMCKGRDGKAGHCPCIRMNCCRLPQDEITKQDLIDGITVLKGALSRMNQEDEK